jgi:hypothetical protein
MSDRDGRLRSIHSGWCRHSRCCFGQSGERGGYRHGRRPVLMEPASGVLLCAGSSGVLPSISRVLRSGGTLPAGRKNRSSSDTLSATASAKSARLIHGASGVRIGRGGRPVCQSPRRRAAAAVRLSLGRGMMAPITPGGGYPDRHPDSDPQQPGDHRPVHGSGALADVASAS